MKEYKVIPQEKDTFCICSVLQAILYKDNIYVSQEDIAQKLNPSEKGFYVDDVLNDSETGGFVEGNEFSNGNKRNGDRKGMLCDNCGSLMQPISANCHQCTNCGEKFG